MTKQCAVGKTIMIDGKEVRLCDETRSQLLPVLQQIQQSEGYISDERMQEVADQFGIHPVEVYSVVTFYSFFSTKEKGQHIIRVSTCMPCEAAGCEDVIKEFEKQLGIKVGETTGDKKFTLERTSCIGMCDQAPAVLVGNKLIGNVTVDKVKEIIAGVDKLESTEQKSFVDKKDDLVLFSALEPYQGLKKAIEIGRKEILSVIRDSNMRGRGGAGFPTGVKWNLAATVQDDKKYVVCNADEGEPGTFKDRVILLENAKALFEGMAIAALAVGTEEGFLYLRGEYMSFKPMLEGVLEEMRKENALGENIMGKDGFNFDIKILLGAGAYVCGEETALIESLEGYRGEPRNRPPFPVNTGLNGHPTIVNNIETFVAAVQIVAKGADWFKSFGTEKSAGTKLLSISGVCDKPGVYEVPFGITVDEMLKMAGAKNAKAVQIGGASGVCIPKEEFGRKIAFEDVPTGGSVMIFGQDQKMLNVSENFLRFFEEESCGQCTPCREGIPVLIEGLEKIQSGLCTKEYLEDLYSLCETMQIASKCGLGQTACRAFEGIMKQYGDEYTLA